MNTCIALQESGEISLLLLFCFCFLLFLQLKVTVDLDLAGTFLPVEVRGVGQNSHLALC